MFKAGLVLRKGPTDNVFDAIRKGYPVREIAQGKPIEVPPTVGQQEASAATQKIEENKPDVIPPGPQQTCPPGYTYALGYCVRDVNYYGCIPGVEFWDGTKCSRSWPKCSEGITNDLNTGQCLGDTPKLGTAEQAIIDMWGPGSNATKDALLAEITKQQPATAPIPAQTTAPQVKQIAIKPITPILDSFNIDTSMPEPLVTVGNPEQLSLNPDYAQITVDDLGNIKTTDARTNGISITNDDMGNITVDGAKTGAFEEFLTAAGIDPASLNNTSLGAAVNRAAGTQRSQAIKKRLLYI